ncbi:MAG: hypothetical protein Ta2F_19120 [Termitinemataceae bacterium]|nr:MAG: hypothetical protein Ta2F_19120 [Termitinemataceae bacterium]
MNVGNVSINKVRKIIIGFTGKSINLSEGFIAKLQKRASAAVAKFCEELRNEILKQKIVYWDDTVIMVNKNRAYLQFDETLKAFMRTKHGRVAKYNLILQLAQL